MIALYTDLWPWLRHGPITGRLFQIVLTKRWLKVQNSTQTGAVLLLCVEKLSWDIRLFVWRKFHFFCGTAVSCICITQTTAFSCYRFHFMYMHAWCVSCNWGRHNAAWLCESVNVALISLWKFKLLAYLLNVTQRFFMCIISYAKVVYFIFI